MYRVFFVVVWSLLINLTCLFAVTIDPSKTNNFYVVPFSKLFTNLSDGSLTHPYSSIEQALHQIEIDYHSNINASQRITTYINLYPTSYFLEKTLHLNRYHSNTHLTTMSSVHADLYDNLSDQHHRLTKARISGGMVLSNWTSIGNNTYTTVVPSSVYANQLFINNQRIGRARVPADHSEYLQFAAPLNNSVQARYGFQYVPGQFDYKSLTDAMVVVYHSWTTSSHFIDRLFPENNTILFTNPSDRPIGVFTVQGNRRFYVENLCETLTSNSFCFVNETKTIYLMTDGSYDPTKAEIITPINDIVLLISSDTPYKPVENISLTNVAIQHSTWNLGRYEQADGFAVAFTTTAALYIANASSLIISSIEISHTGLYGAWIEQGTTNIDFLDSYITDTGAGGIRVGQMNTPTFPTTLINILSNEVCNGGYVYPSGVGIIVHRGNNIAVVDNHVHHMRYSGIVLGIQLAYYPSYTSNLLCQGNYVHDIGQHILCDQGGIYALGIQPGTIIHGNLIKNIYSYAVFMWGIYLDEGTSDITVSNNVVYNTGWASLFLHYGANNTIINNVFARASTDPPPHPTDPLPDGDVRVERAENHTSWTFTRNIIYDIYQGVNHSAFISNPYAITSFDNNVYYNRYNTPLKFGWQQLPFEQWQQTGQDNQSIIADPLFGGDVDQCDFFTIRADSPAAKLGFKNLTKHSKWTPGCEKNFIEHNNNFVHW